MTGIEWLIEARGCDPARLRDQRALEGLLAEMIRDLSLQVVGAPMWHVFPGAAGLTGMYLLAESHLTVHTFPEHRALCLNLFCCRPRPDWPFAQRLASRLGATDVDVRKLDRRYAELPAALAT